jgi:hypothetical protein
LFDLQLENGVYCIDRSDRSCNNEFPIRLLELKIRTVQQGSAFQSSPLLGAAEARLAPPGNTLLNIALLQVVPIA